MAFSEYILVGESDIYDKQGFSKAIFLQMAGLIQTKEKFENGSPNPNLGWVVQTEKWIAERLAARGERVKVWILEQRKIA